jgi:glycogen operon protein
MRKSTIETERHHPADRELTMKSWASTEGSPFPQGSSWVESEQAYNFSLYSKHAEAVTLLLYRRADLLRPALTVALDPHTHKSGRFWHCRLPKAQLLGVEFYAYTVAGPPARDSRAWHCFNPSKILLDPYAGSIFFPDAFDRSAACKPGSNAGQAPLAVLAACEEAPPVHEQARVGHDADAILCEVHVRGFTMDPSSGVAPGRRGTYLGLMDKLPYLKGLGVTVLELMPIFQGDPQEGSAWGYMPLGFFAPNLGYASRGEDGVQRPQGEFRAMARAFRAAGIEVVLDVVYNHTCEGDEHGPLFSFKGIDNSTYYVASERPGDRYEDFSGTGNTFHCANRQVRRLILDSLRHWAAEGADGFRFDLASVFNRRLDGSVDPNDPKLFSDIIADPELVKLRLIAEPWDVSVNQLGLHLPGGATWAQWNGRYRDDLRRFVRGDNGLAGALMRRLYGSDDLFTDELPSSGRPSQSVNFVTAHDGFTLYDLVSYGGKHNQANGHGGTDGTDRNYSWNCGWEGDDGLPQAVLALRKRQAKNLCCLLFLSNGTPMFRAGDEFLQTQGGNNNPYNQDNPSTWLQWGRLQDHADHFRFFRLMIAFRRAHPSLCRSHFWREDVLWHGVGALPDLSEGSHSLAFCLLGASEGDDDLYVMINAWWEGLTFAFQGRDPGRWLRVVDTGQPSPADFLEPGQEAAAGPHYPVMARSVAVFRRPSGASGGPSRPK